MSKPTVQSANSAKLLIHKHYNATFFIYERASSLEMLLELYPRAFAIQNCSYPVMVAGKKEIIRGVEALIHRADLPETHPLYVPLSYFEPYYKEAIKSSVFAKNRPETYKLQAVK